MSNNYEFIIRFIICLLFSLIIGYERDSRNQFGLKLYMLVCTGTFLFVSLAIKGMEENSMRLVSQVVSGISFLGTGAIIINNNELKGLNVAATMWCITAIGMLTGFGYVFEALIGTIVVVIVNRFVNSTKINGNNDRNIDNNDYYIKICYDKNIDINNKLGMIRDNISKKKMRLSLINRDNICILYVSNIDYNKMKLFIIEMSNDKDIRYIHYDIC